MKSLTVPKILPVEYPPPIPAPHTRTGTSANRLVRMVANTVVGPQQRLDFAYEHQGRGITKGVWNNTAGTGALAVDQKFLYDGWNLVAVLGAVNTLLRSFAWGPDISGTFQGAGGVGGLLWIHDISTLNKQPSTHFVAHDGNGNVTMLVNAAAGNDSARYEYGPFGELIRATGLMAKSNPFRFSTKYQGDETGLLYYGYQYYNASTGRWISRDPKGERAARNLYSFVQNNGIGGVDVLGLGHFEWAPTPPHDGGKPGGLGTVVWDPFDPQAQVYSPNGCCFQVHLNGGKATPWVLFNQGTLWDENIVEHELYHVEHHFRPAYDNYKSAAAKLGAPCMSKGRTVYIAAVIQAQLSAEYQARTYRDGAAYDYLDYGWRAGQDAWYRMQQTEEEYQQAQEATASALASCPAN